MLYDNSVQLFERENGAELHVDRSLNVLSSGSMHKAYFKEILPIILEIFNDPNIKQQPAFVIDTGCGDGAFLQEVYEQVKSKTVRGKYLDSNPLLMIGVDFNQASLRETEKRLSKKKVPFKTLFGDIGNPAQIYKDLAKHEVDVSKRILHIRSFLDHDRPYLPSKSQTEGLFFESSIAYSDRLGNKLEARGVLSSLVEHLQRWREILKPQDDLMILEVHCLPPKKAYIEREQSISLHFDLIQALSGQFLVSAENFLLCSAMAGLQSTSSVRFPENKPFSRITFNHFRRESFYVQKVFSKHEALEEQFSESKKAEGGFLLKDLSSHEVLTASGITNLNKDEESNAIYLPSIYLSFNNKKSKNSHLDKKLLEFIYNIFSFQRSFRSLCISSSNYFYSKLNRIISEFHEKEGRIWYLFDETEKNQSNYIRLFSQEQIFQKLEEEISTLLGKKFQLALEDSILSLGLDSLELGKLARGISKFIGTKVKITMFFKQASIKDLIEELISINQKEIAVIEKSTSQDQQTFLPLALSQEPMWMWFKLIGDTSAYNVPRIEHLKGFFSVEAFTQALKEVISRHEILRSKYSFLKGQPMQEILPLSQYSLPFQIVNIQKNDMDVDQIIEEEIEKPFALTEGETLRALLIQIKQDEQILLITMHHMVTDGSSIPIFWHEIVTCYNAFLKKIPPILPKLSTQYVTWAQRQIELYRSGKWSNQLSYWKEVLQEDLPTLDLPTDFPYPEEQTFNGDRLEFVVPANTMFKLQNLCKDTRSTVFMIVTSLWGVFLSLHSGQKEVILATPWANRDDDNVQNLIGCFVNTLPLYLKINPEDTFLDYLEQVKHISFEAFEHASIPFHKIVETLKLQSSNGRLPVYQTMVALEEENGWIKGDVPDGLARVERDKANHKWRKTSKFEISLSVRVRNADSEAILSGEFVFNTDLFSLPTAERMKQRFLHLVENLIENPTKKLNEIDLVSQKEKKKIEKLSKGKVTSIPGEKTVFHLFEEQAKKHPQKTAVWCKGQSYTYDQLWKYVNYFSSYLQKQKVNKGDFVAFLLERNLSLIISLLSVNQIGAVFVPICPTYPLERQEFVIKNSGANFLILSDSFSCSDRVKNIIIGQNFFSDLEEVACNRRPKPDDLAYLLYTSGTTGVPKGVKITHGNLINDIIHLIQEQIPSKDYKLTLFSTNVIFDQFVEEFYGPLCSGNCICLVENILESSWKNLPVTHLVTTPSQMNLLLRGYIPKSLNSIVLGGEELSQVVVNKIFETTDIQIIYNSYGPTECTDQVSVCKLTREKPLANLGRPISNTSLYVLGLNQEISPIGVWGELYIGGKNVGLGYHKNSHLTKKYFLPDPFQKGIMYKTGDFARWNIGGYLEYKGRIDSQIKISGVRIEKEEIESVIDLATI